MRNIQGYHPAIHYYVRSLHAHMPSLSYVSLLYRPFLMFTVHLINGHIPLRPQQLHCLFTRRSTSFRQTHASAEMAVGYAQCLAHSRHSVTGSSRICKVGVCTNRISNSANAHGGKWTHMMNGKYCTGRTFRWFWPRPRHHHPCVSCDHTGT